MRYNPPDGVTPALARLVWCGAYDVRVFVTALVSIAAKGWMSVHLCDGIYTLKSTEAGSLLHAREQQLLDRLFAVRGSLDVSGSSYIDLHSAQLLHHELIMDEQLAIFSSPLLNNRFLEGLAGWAWPKAIQRRRRILGQAKNYRRYLDTAMRHRLDPVFTLTGQMERMPDAMPYAIAFEIENSMGDGLVDAISAMLSDTAHTTSIYDLGDQAHRRNPGKVSKLANAAERRKQEQEDNDFLGKF